MKKVQNKENFLEKKDLLKKQIFRAIGVDSDIRIQNMLSRICSDGRIEYSKYGGKKLSNDEETVAEILRVCEISPRTAYRWFRLCNSPKETLELVQCNKLSMNKLAKMYRGVRKKYCDPNTEFLGKQIMKDVVKVIEVI